jgi:ribosomal protein L21
MKNAPSISSHDSITLPQLHDLIEHAGVETHVENHEKDNNIVTQKSKRLEHAGVETHVKNHEEDNNIVTRKNKRRMTTKSFGEDYIRCLVDDTPKTIEEAYSSLDADL